MEKNGGRPKKETSGFQNEKTSGYKNKKPNKNNNVNENENVNVNNNNNNNASDSCIDGLQKVIGFYNENIGLITPYGIEILTEYTKEMPEELIIYAMQISVEANKKTIQYIKAILNNWQKAGIKTLIEAKKSHKGRKQNTKSNFEGRNYTQEELNSLFSNNFE